MRKAALPDAGAPFNLGENTRFCAYMGGIAIDLSK